MTYTIEQYKFHKIFIYSEDKTPIGPFSRFEKEQLQSVIGIMNKQEQLLKPIQKICEKYKIPIQDLPETLEEYISRDNEEE